MRALRLPVADGAAVRRRFAAIIAERKGPFAVVTGLQLAAACTALGIPRLLGAMVDTVTKGGPGGAAHLVSLVWAVAALAAVNTMLTGLGEYRARVLGERVFADLRERLIDKVVHLPLGVVESAGTGDLLGRTSRDLEAIRMVVQRGVSQILVIVMTIGVVFVGSLLVSVSLGLVMLTALLAVPVVRWYMRRAVPAYQAMNALWAEANGVVAETADQAGTVAAQGLGQRRNDIFDRSLREVWHHEIYTAWLRGLLQLGLGLVSTLPLLAVLAWGAWLLGRGQVTLGEVTAVALYAEALRGPVHELNFWVDSLQSASTSLGRIVGVDLVEPDRRAVCAQAASKPPRLQGVSYAYRQGQDVLHEVDLELVPGERLAVVGPSGSGKSTLGRLLAGIHPPTRGRVTLQASGASAPEVDLVSLTEEALHQQVVLVTQEHHVFSCSLADNLRLARPEATDAELSAALDAVGATAWTQGLPEGLETLVGAGGQVLSPGQAQQVALARIVLMDPATLVLDEAMSLLDPGVARSTERALDALLAGRTVVAIAHRLDTAAAADRVAVVLEGRIVEVGAHAELVAAQGEYCKLWQAWTSS